MKKPKIAMIIPCWGRAEVFDLVCAQLDVFHSETQDKIDLIVLYIFSPEDSELQELELIYHDANHTRDRIYSKNSQLGKKLNDGIEYASRFEYDYIMNMGSDDLIHPGLIDLYLPFMKAQVPIIGISSLYFLTKNEDPIFFFYYNSPHVIGAARMIHISVVQRVNLIKGSVYSVDIRRNMDTNSARRMYECGYNQKSIYKGDFPYIIDIKSDVNINSFQHITREVNHDRYRRVKATILKREFEVLKSF